MEGIDRLHEIAEDVGRTVWLRDLGAALSETADAIEGGTSDPSGYESDVLAWVEENGGLDAVRERLMPGGMSWPRYAGGSPVEIGDDVVGPDYGERIHVDEVVFHANGFTLRSKGGDGKWYESDDRFQRPAKVLDADGMEVHKGDEVWSTTGEFDGKRTVSSVHIDPDEPPYAMFEELQKPYSCLCCHLTHQRPVFDADGVPIKKGDTVWLVYQSDSDWKFTVANVLAPNEHSDGKWSVKIKSDWGVFTYREPSQLTHTKPEPDSWSSVWADVSNGNETPEGMMRRCRALAERGE